MKKYNTMVPIWCFAFAYRYQRYFEREWNSLQKVKLLFRFTYFAPYMQRIYLNKVAFLL